MRGRVGMTQRPPTLTKVGRLDVEKNPSGSTPSAGSGSNRASGAPANGGLVKSGDWYVVVCDLSAVALIGRRKGRWRREGIQAALRGLTAPSEDRYRIAVDHDPNLARPREPARTVPHHPPQRLRGSFEQHVPAPALLDPRD